MELYDVTHPPTESTAPDDGFRPSARDAEIHRVLMSWDPALAGLFEFFLRALEEVARPGGIYILGHAGRELSRGVLAYLAQDGRSLSGEEQRSISKEEKFRSTISRALRARPHHPSVTAWFNAYNDLVACAHYDTKEGVRTPYSMTEALAAARALLGLLWSRTGPFFDTRKDVERLLAIEHPTETDIAALRAALTRPAVRLEFFKRLERAGWVTPLLSAGFFRDPPNLLPPGKDGKQSWEGWAEGDYLRRMAGRASANVRDVLATIPETWQNPYVWDAAAEAAKAMPADIAVTLVSLFKGALEISPPVIFHRTLAELAIQLGEAGKEEAFVLVREVLRAVAGVPSIPSLLIGIDRRDAALAGLDDYEAEQLIPRLADALCITDAEKALRFLVHRLNDALVIEWQQPSEEPTWGPSKYWCPDLSQAEDGHGYKEHLAVAIGRVASKAAAKSPSDAAGVLALIVKQPWDIYSRLRLYVLAHAGRHTPDLLNAAIGDAAFVEMDYPPNEYELVLVSQFEHANHSSRQVVIDAIMRGPGTDEELKAELGLPRFNGRVNDRTYAAC
jgi:hypothetical protein